MQWTPGQLGSLERILRTAAHPGPPNLVSLNVSAVGAEKCSCTLTLSTDGQSCRVVSPRFSLELHQCVGYLSDEETHRALIICAETDELVTSLVIDGLSGSVEFKTSADSIAVLSEFTSPKAAITTALQKNLSHAAVRLADAKAYAHAARKPLDEEKADTPVSPCRSQMSSLRELRESEESLNKLMKRLSRGSAKVSTSVERYRQHVQSVSDLDLEGDLSSLLNTSSPTAGPPPLLMTQQDVLVPSAKGLVINYKGCEEIMEVNDCDWMALVQTAVEDKLPWLDKLVHDHVLSVGQDLRHPIGARIHGFAQSQKCLLDNSGGELVPVVQTILSFCSAMRNVVYLGFDVLEEIDDDDVEAQVYSAIEKATFKQLDVDVFGLFCQAYHEQDVVWASCISKMRSASPADHGVNHKFILDAKGVFPDLLSTDGSQNMAGAGVYQPAVDRLRELPEMVGVVDKVVCFKETCDLIFQAIEDHYGRGTCAVGADDLLPLLSYVMIQAAPAEMESQLQFIEKFLPDCLARGQFAYFSVCTRVVVGSIVDAASQGASGKFKDRQGGGPSEDTDSHSTMDSLLFSPSDISEWWK
eukprot:TRINITY_DN13454_c0_g2_i2.p1 TRINITY_DN13454_c0_g2~~TRINITY_DN13454_c0_g2_i2.p1  ORF type:complete len:584 (-),score=148.52 TRINITY_DN13454_c0_g2_i2:421-2172(-)